MSDQNGQPLSHQAATNCHSGSFHLEKRRSPRFRPGFHVRFNNGVIGRICDFSPEGMALELEGDSTADLPLGPMQITDGKLAILIKNFKVVRRTKINKDRYMHAVAIEESIQHKNWWDLIISQAIIDGFSKKIDSDVMAAVKSFFLGTVKQHIQELIEISELTRKEDENKNPSKSIKIEQKFFSTVDEVLKKAQQLEKVISNRIVLKKVKTIFRNLIGHWIYQGGIVKRAYEQPRGYPGDYLTLDMIYENKSASTGIGYFSDKYFLANSYAVAVRHRLKKVETLLNEFINKSGNSEFKIFDIACGSCMEIREMFQNIIVPNAKKVAFTLVDHDSEALEFARQNLPRLGNVSYEFVCEDVLRLAQNTAYKDKLHLQDLVYTIGLADYLPDRVLKAMIKFCIQIMAPGGAFILAHKDSAVCEPVAPDWFCDWRFYPRTESDVIDLISSSVSEASRQVSIRQILREETGKIFFVLVQD